MCIARFKVEVIPLIFPLVTDSFILTDIRSFC